MTSKRTDCEFDPKVDLQSFLSLNFIVENADMMLHCDFANSGDGGACLSLLCKSSLSADQRFFELVFTSVILSA